MLPHLGGAAARPCPPDSAPDEFLCPISERVEAFEAVVVAEERRAERARSTEIENLKLAVEAADLAGVGGTDIDGARSLLRELLNPTTQDTVAAEADEEVEARHTGGLQVVEQ